MTKKTVYTKKMIDSFLKFSSQSKTVYVKYAKKRLKELKKQN